MCIYPFASWIKTTSPDRKQGKSKALLGETYIEGNRKASVLIKNFPWGSRNRMSGRLLKLGRSMAKIQWKSISHIMIMTMNAILGFTFPLRYRHNHKRNHNHKKMIDHFLMIIIMSIISVYMITFFWRFKRHKRLYDYDYDCYVARGNQPSTNQNPRAFVSVR